MANYSLFFHQTSFIEEPSSFPPYSISENSTEIAPFHESLLCSTNTQEDSFSNQYNSNLNHV